MNSFIQKDLKHIWHPYTQMKDCEKLPPILVEKAKGIKIYDNNGNFYYDTISSWWCNVHGHNHPFIKAAIKKQLDRFEHVLFAGFTHKPAIDLAQKLVEITPQKLQRVFFSDNGSTAVEVAMKMSFQYWKNINKPERNYFVSLDKAYHGDTIGVMSVSGVDLFNSKFKPLFFKSFKAPSPYCYRCPFGEDKDSCALECLKKMENILKAQGKRVCAVVIEPLVMCAAGMLVYPEKYLKGVAGLAQKYGVHLILDEVATGFGRTGKMFALEHVGITPDFICLSKGITSGYLPLGATLTTDKVFSAFYDDYDKLKTFYHGHTFTANPISCVAAGASIELFSKEDSFAKIKDINNQLNLFLDKIRDLPMVGDIRSKGVIGAMELVADKKTKEPFGLNKRVGMEVYRAGLKNGLILRPLGNVVYFFLPICVRSGELNDIFKRAEKVMKKLADDLF